MENTHKSTDITEPSNEGEGYPVYPPSDDIFARKKEVHGLNLDTNMPLPPVEEAEPSDEEWNEKNFDEELTGDDLDVPGSELDEDGEERPGEEDEENEYYSLGGDDHDDLDEE